MAPADTLSPPPELNRHASRESVSPIIATRSSAGTSTRNSTATYPNGYERDTYPDDPSPTFLASGASPYLTTNEQHEQSPNAPAPLFTRASPALSTHPTAFIEPGTLIMEEYNNNTTSPTSCCSSAGMPASQDPRASSNGSSSNSNNKADKRKSRKFGIRRTLRRHHHRSASTKDSQIQ